MKSFPSDILAVPFSAFPEDWHQRKRSFFSLLPIFRGRWSFGQRRGHSGQVFRCKAGLQNGSERIKVFAMPSQKCSVPLKIPQGPIGDWDRPCVGCEQQGIGRALRSNMLFYGAETGAPKLEGNWKPSFSYTQHCPTFCLEISFSTKLIARQFHSWSQMREPFFICPNHSLHLFGLGMISNFTKKNSLSKIQITFLSDKENFQSPVQIVKEACSPN